MTQRNAQKKHKKTRSKKHTVSLSIKKYVKASIHRSIENKIAKDFKSNGALIGPYDGTTDLITFFDISQALAIPQGTGQGDRVGNRITPVRFVMKGHIVINDDTETPQPKNLLVRMFFFRSKQEIDAPTTFINLYQNGNTTQPPTNLPQDMYLSFNKDDYTIYKQRRFSLGSVNNIIGSSTIGSNNGINGVQMFTFDLKKYLPKHITFADAFTTPTNVGLYVGFVLCHADGSGLPATPGPLVNISYAISTEYEDS